MWSFLASPSTSPRPKLQQRLSNTGKSERDGCCKRCRAAMASGRLAIPGASLKGLEVLSVVGLRDIASYVAVNFTRRQLECFGDNAVFLARAINHAGFILIAALRVSCAWTDLPHVTTIYSYYVVFCASRIGIAETAVRTYVPGGARGLGTWLGVAGVLSVFTNVAINKSL